MLYVINAVCNLGGVDQQVLHVIDFDQLKIENQQYLEKIEERNNELLRLKLTTGKTFQVCDICVTPAQCRAQRV
jgi:hypothetical protein